MRRIKVCSGLFFLSILWHHGGFSQDWAWANYIPWSFNVPTGNTPVYIDVHTNAITHDTGGNACVTGHIDVEDGDNGDDASIFFVAKFNANGQLDWLRQYGEPFGPEACGEDIIADAAGNIYVTGTFRATLQFSNTISLTCTGGSNDDIFIVKYNPQGVVQWARKAGGNSWDSGHGIALDSQGNILITGSLRGSAYFGNSIVSIDTSPNSTDYFVAKYDQSGNALWVKRGSSSNYNEAQGKRISVDSLGQFWSIGTFDEEITIDNVTLTATPKPDQPTYNYDIFVAKHDASGNLLWAKNFGGDGFETPGGIVCDHQGNGYITGHFYKNISLDNITLTTLTSSDGFVAKMNSAGNILWAKGINGGGYDEGKGVDVDANDNCYVVGALSADYGAKLFVKKYKPNGDLDWTREAKKHSTIDYGEISGNAISTDADGNSYVAGTFFGDLVSFDNMNVPGTHGQQSGYGIMQGSVAKLSATDIFFPPYVDPGVWEEWPIKPGPDPASSLKAYPNPSDDIITLQFSNPGRDRGYLGIYNQRGQLISTQEFSGDLEQRISFRQYGTDFYYARVVVGEEAHMQTIIIE